MDLTAVRERLNTVIFGTDTPAGKLFDVVLISAILVSVAAVMLDSVASINRRFGAQLYVLEWLFTLVFTAEYLVRIWISPRPSRYIFSFYGLVDLLAVIPTYLALVLPGAKYLLIIRLLRVLRIFRVLKLVRYSREATTLLRAIGAARRKILVFFGTVLVLTTVFGSLMFLVEGPDNGFTSIPKSIYWTVVTITTVGYGDITPQTVLGQVISVMAMLTGYSIIAIPTGIVSAELIEEMRRDRERDGGNRRCGSCGAPDHREDARFCHACGEAMTGRASSPDGG